MGVARACVRVISNSALGCSEVNRALSSDRCGLVSRRQTLPAYIFLVGSVCLRETNGPRYCTIHTDSRHIGSVSCPTMGMACYQCENYAPSILNEVGRLGCAMSSAH